MPGGRRQWEVLPVRVRAGCGPRTGCPVEATRLCRTTFWHSGCADLGPLALAPLRSWSAVTEAFDEFEKIRCRCLIDGPGYCDQWHCLEAGLGYHAPTLSWIAFGLGFGIPGGVGLTHALLWSVRGGGGNFYLLKSVVVLVAFCFYAGALMVTVYTSGVFPLVICFSIATAYPAVVVVLKTGRAVRQAMHSMRTPQRRDLPEASDKL